MPDFSFEDPSQYQDDKDVSILPENSMDTVFDRKEPDSIDPDTPETYDGEEPDFSEPELSQNIPYDGEEPDFSEPPADEPPSEEDAHKGKIFFEFSKGPEIESLQTTEAVPSLTHQEPEAEKKEEENLPPPHKKYIQAIAVAIAFAYSASWTKFTQNDYGVIGRILQDFAAAWENAIKAQCTNVAEDSSQQRATSLLFSKDFPALAYIINIEDLEELLQELQRIEQFLQDTIARYPDDEFQYYREISATHTFYLGRLRKKFSLLHTADEEIEWICTSCHVTVSGKDAPEECPHCHASTFYFMPLTSFYPYEALS